MPADMVAMVLDGVLRGLEVVMYGSLREINNEKMNV